MCQLQSTSPTTVIESYFDIRLQLKSRYLAMSAAPERGQQVLPGSVPQPVAEDSENRTSPHEPPAPASRSQSMLSRLGSHMGPFEPKSIRGAPATPTSSGKRRERRPALSKSVSVRSLISQSNSVHRMDPVDRSSSSATAAKRMRVQTTG